MGLDMYAFAVKESLLPEDVRSAEVDVKLGDDIKAEEIAYWRKHHDLHGWMQELYNRKGGSSPDFNCNTVRLSLDDLDDLEKTVRGHMLPETTGFFFGSNPPDEESMLNDLKFIEEARERINDGYAVFYDSWW